MGLGGSGVGDREEVIKGALLWMWVRGVYVE